MTSHPDPAEAVRRRFREASERAALAVARVPDGLPERRPAAIATAYAKLEAEHAARDDSASILAGLAVAVAEAASELYDAGRGWLGKSDGDALRRISVACDAYRAAVEAYRAAAGDAATEGSELR